MEIFKKDDGYLDVITKIVTVASFVFGIFVYIHTIHPVFQKESELQDLRKEKVSLQNENNNLVLESNKLKKEADFHEKKLSELTVRELNLKEEVESKTSELAIVSEKLKVSHDIAVFSKLNLIMDKIISEYILSISQGKSGNFDVVGYSYELKATQARGKKLKGYDADAYDYFSNYIEMNKEKDFKSNEDIVSYAIMLPYSYKINKKIDSELLQ